jgi:uncharacterized membrane protein
MANLIAAVTFFVLIHLLVSGTRLRDVLTGGIGQNAYMGLFSLASLGGLIWVGLAYAGARTTSANFWDLSTGLRHGQVALQLLAMLLILVGLLTPNPTSVRQEGALDRPDVVQGILRITRHPFLWGVAIWAAGHLIANGDLASLVLFGSMLALALFGTASIDAKRRRALGPAWETFAGQTSNIPFAAIVTGRQVLKLSEIGMWRPAAAVAVWAALAFAHPYLFGVPALS